MFPRPDNKTADQSNQCSTDFIPSGNVSKKFSRKQKRRNSTGTTPEEVSTINPSGIPLPVSDLVLSPRMGTPLVSAFPPKKHKFSRPQEHVNTQVLDFMSIKQSKLSDRSFGITNKQFLQKNRNFNQKNRLKIPQPDYDSNIPSPYER